MNFIMEKTAVPKTEKAEKHIAVYDRLLTQKEKQSEKKEDTDYDYLITI